MRISANLEDRFIPKFNGNLELPSGEQIVVEILWPNQGQREMLKSYSVGLGTNKISVDFNTERILRNHVGRIDNLEIEINGKSEAITNGKQLAGTTAKSLGPLIDEIKAHVTSEESIEEDVVKN